MRADRLTECFTKAAVVVAAIGAALTPHGPAKDAEGLPMRLRAKAAAREKKAKTARRAHVLQEYGGGYRCVRCCKQRAVACALPGEVPPA